MNDREKQYRYCMPCKFARINTGDIVCTLPKGYCAHQPIQCYECKHVMKYYHCADSNLGMFTYFCKRVGFHVHANNSCDMAEWGKNND